MKIRNEFRSCLMLPLCILLALAVAVVAFVAHHRTAVSSENQPYSISGPAVIGGASTSGILLA